MDAVDSCSPMELSAAEHSGFVFTEVLPKRNDEKRQKYVDAFIGTLAEPSKCGPLIKRLSYELPLNQLAHLKRVRRTQLPNTLNSSTTQGLPATEQSILPDSLSNEAESPQPKKAKRRKKEKPPSSFLLEIVLGACSHWEQKNDEGTIRESQRHSIIESLQSKYPLQNIRVESVPACHPESKAEWEEFQSIWPTSFFQLKSQEFKNQELQLSAAEVAEMALGMQAAIHDSTDNHPGAIMVQPATTSDGSISVMATSLAERKLQQPTLPHDYQNPKNPLVTSILLAIQGMSRLERQQATDKGMDSESFQKGQYLCTGYDLFTTQEPSVFEAMALVHSRVRRVIFLEPPSSTHTDRPYIKGLTSQFVHHLPGTNHKFRAFACRRKDTSH